MNNKRFFALLITFSLLCTLVLPTYTAVGQGSKKKKKPAGEKSEPIIDPAGLQISRTHRAPESNVRTLQPQPQPEWVEEALQKALEALQSQSQGLGIVDAFQEFALIEAQQDGRNYVDVKLRQVHQGVEVFGGQLIVHLDDNKSMDDLSGRMFPEARIDTRPAISSEQATEFARAGVAEVGEFPGEPAVKLVILPEKIRANDGQAEGATLAYQVDLRSEEAGGEHRCFVSAGDGGMLLHYPTTAHVLGQGRSGYSGRVEVNTNTNPVPAGSFILQDPDRGFSEVRDAQNTLIQVYVDKDGNVTDMDSGQSLVDSNNVWGDGNLATLQTQAVDVHYGLAKSWDYFKFKQGRYGPDGNSTAIVAMTRAAFLDSSKNTYFTNASASTIRHKSGVRVLDLLQFGVGDGTGTNPWVPIDVVGHEYTHLVINHTANLEYRGESGAINESYADIFGTAIEFYANPARADYLIGEDMYLSPGNYLRSMENPASKSDPDHYSNRVSKDCTPTDKNDNCGVHTDSGIMNQAFYLMAEGGTNRTSSVFVTGIGRETAQNLFYLALVRGLTSTSTFADVARATLGWAIKLYGNGSEVALSVERAWGAVGVLPTNSLPTTVRQPDLESERLLFYWADTPWGRTGLLNRAGDFVKKNQYYTFSTDWTHVVAMGTNIFFYSSKTGAGAVGDIDYNGNFNTLRGFPAGTFAYSSFNPSTGQTRRGWSHITYHEGYLLFYEEWTGKAEIGRADASGYRTIFSYPTIGPGWTTITSTAGRLLFYNANTGRAVIDDWNYSANPLNIQVLKIYDNFSTGWTHIVDGGQYEGRPVGTLFYNANTGAYVVGDIDDAGNFTTRTSNPRWSYTGLGPNWTHITRVGQGLMFYNQWSGQVAVGHLLTRFESDSLRREPYRYIKSYIESTGYTHLTSTLPR